MLRGYYWINDLCNKNFVQYPVKSTAIVGGSHENLIPGDGTLLGKQFLENNDSNLYTLEL